jgi:hypothetical protein
MSEANDLICEWISPCGKFTARFDDNGRVAYLYFVTDKVVVGHVWVYNRCADPDPTEWTVRREEAPANLKEYIVEARRPERPVPMDALTVRWKYSGKRPRVLLYIDGSLVASLAEDERPGYCRYALKDGPCAKVLEDGNGDGWV